MKPGDMIQYRCRKETDPHPSDVGEMGCWGATGIVVRLLQSQYPPDGEFHPSIEYIDDAGDWVICKQSDVKIVSELGSINQSRSG